ncbi:hypothetical protein CF327_g5846 [Tilletia walkeri]|nr:hypothetical protein CF327_g5846 [Tilletia walkeri]
MLYVSHVFGLGPRTPSAHHLRVGIQVRWTYPRGQETNLSETSSFSSQRPHSQHALRSQMTQVTHNTYPQHTHNAQPQVTTHTQ